MPRTATARPAGPIETGAKFTGATSTHGKLTAAKRSAVALVGALLAAAAIAAVLTAPAAAQMPMGISLGTDKPPPTPEEVARQKVIDNAYKSATNKIPNQGAVANDPWADVRQSPAAPAPKKKQP